MHVRMVGSVVATKTGRLESHGCFSARRSLRPTGCSKCVGVNTLRVDGLSPLVERIAAIRLGVDRMVSTRIAAFFDSYSLWRVRNRDAIWLAGVAMLRIP